MGRDGCRTVLAGLRHGAEGRGAQEMPGGIADHVAEEERMAWCDRRPEGRRREKDGIRSWKTIAVAILSIHTPFSLSNHGSKYF
jgi:hypothetical protein